MLQTVPYLHKLAGGYSNDKRRDVRRLFANIITVEASQMICEDNIGIAVGILLELKQIGITKFTNQHAVKIVEIFNLSSNFGCRDVSTELHQLFVGQKIRLWSTCNSQNDNYNYNNMMYYMPDDAHLLRLSDQFCKGTENN